MSAADWFFDTSVLLCLLSKDATKANRIKELLAGRSTISVQVLNEFAAVAMGKLRMYCEDLQHGQLIDRQLRIVNPFVAR